MFGSLIRGSISSQFETSILTGPRQTGHVSVEAPLVAFSTGIRTPIGAVFTIPFFLICGLEKENDNEGLAWAGAGEGVGDGNDVGKELRLDMLKRSFLFVRSKEKPYFVTTHEQTLTHSLTHSHKH
jgi:hypothetical protein